MSVSGLRFCVGLVVCSQLCLRAFGMRFVKTIDDVAKPIETDVESIVSLQSSASSQASPSSQTTSWGDSSSSSQAGVAPMDGGVTCHDHSLLSELGKDWCKMAESGETMGRARRCRSLCRSWRRWQPWQELASTPALQESGKTWVELVTESGLRNLTMSEFERATSEFQHGSYSNNAYMYMSAGEDAPQVCGDCWCCKQQPQCKILAEERKDCLGFLILQVDAKSECRKRECCWQDFTANGSQPWCYKTLWSES